MKSDNWRKISEILPDCLQLSVSERRKYLDALHLSGELRAELEEFLTFETEIKDFMSRTAADGVAKDFFSPTEFDENLSVGQRIGVYRTIKEIGFGGMGAVYLAERIDGKFEQKVAIKMLKREFNVGRIRQTFRREKEILSKLNHPFIARLLDAGRCDDGVPYLVMEYVEGLPIDKFCACENLSLKERLKLFNKVCEAVSFAHQNLIVHRDLKPSNIIVTKKGEPKLLDFGISKLLDADDSAEKTALTLPSAMTPEYASPEQIRGETVSTATDVYSLGVVLYKMLTGALPYKISGKTNGNMLKAITEDEPIAPSAIWDLGFGISDFKSKISVSKSSASQGNGKLFDKLRQNENPKSEIPNPKSLKGDLDNIILKSLCKEPERRYRTIEQFSADIWRHLDGLPVFARRATASYRAAKFFKRNKIAVIAAALIFITLIGGIVVSLRQTSMAREAERFSAIERDKAKTEQAKSEKITRFMSKIIGYANPGWFAEGAKLSGQARVIDALEDLSSKIDAEFAEEPDVAAEIHYKFAEVFHWVSMGKSENERQYYQKKRRLHALRGLELRKQFYGEWHELVAKDLYGAYGLIGTNERERAALLMRAILMMRDTNPNNINLPYMLESYTAHIMLPEFAERHEPYRSAALPATDENKYQIAERMLRESLPLFRLHYQPDNLPIFAAECKLAYTLAVQKKWTDFDEHYSICQQYDKKLGDERSKEDIKKFVELIERILAESQSEKR